MKFTFACKKISLNDSIKEYAEKKISKLDKYFPEDTEAHVTLSVEKNRHIVEITIPYSGGIIRGEEVSGDMYASIDTVIAKVEKQIMRHRTKLEKNLRAEAFAAQEASYAVDDEEEEEHKVVRVKRFAIKPMDVEEAVLQMELLGHSFYVFENAEDGEVNVLYQRKDGNYGLIEPEC